MGRSKQGLPSHEDLTADSPLALLYRFDTIFTSSPLGLDADGASSADMVATQEPPVNICPANVLQAIYGDSASKKAAYEKSLSRWWKEYSDRKNDEEDEHVADSLLYDRNHLPRAAPPPESVFQERLQAQQRVIVDFREKPEANS